MIEISTNSSSRKVIEHKKTFLKLSGMFHNCFPCFLIDWRGSQAVWEQSFFVWGDLLKALKSSICSAIHTSALLYIVIFKRYGSTIIQILNCSDNFISSCSTITIKPRFSIFVRLVSNVFRRWNFSNTMTEGVRFTPPLTEKYRHRGAGRKTYILAKHWPPTLTFLK